MKKILSMGLLTVCALMVAEQRAHAWVNGKFSIGLNWQVQSANNSILWGVFKNGQVPGPEAFGMPGCGGGFCPPGGGGGGHFGPGGGYMPPAAQQSFPWFGGVPGQNPAAPAGFVPPGHPQGVPTNGPTNSNTQAAYHSPFQNVSYQQTAYQMYYPYGSRYPAQVPYYWYPSR